jgi:hypothetical protein
MVTGRSHSHHTGSFRLVATVFCVMALLCPDGRSVHAQNVSQPPHSTLVFYGAPHLPQDLWPALFSTLQQDLAVREGAFAEAALLDPAPEMIRGSELQSGNIVHNVVVVHLIGRCDVLPQAAWSPSSKGPLGWVNDNHGQIAPFIDIDCSRIAQVLNVRALGMSRQDRRQAFCQAISHVLIHEWIHIATQSASHAPKGIESAQLTPDELIAAPPQPFSRSSGGR